MDTNVVLSALLFAGGAIAALRSFWQSGACRPLVSSATAQELLRVLAYPKFHLDSDQQLELLADYLPYALSVRIPSPPPKVPACRDRFDLPFLHLAAAGKAACLITGDRDLLALSGKTPFAIVTPSAFLSGL